MPVSLTYSNYPHILDAVIAETSFKAQVALRLVSKSLRGAVDRVHLHHLVLTPLGSDSVSVRGPHYPVPALRRMKPKAWRKNPKLELTTHTRIVDIRGFFPATCNLTHLKAAFPNLNTLRMCSSRETPQSYTPYIPFGAKTLVLFTNPNGGDCNPSAYDEWDEEDEEDEPELAPKGVHKTFPETFTKFVVNMNGDDIPIADMFHFVVDPPKHVKEITIVIPRYHSVTAAGAIDNFTEHIVAMDTAELIGARDVKYTLVGLDRVRPGYDKTFLNVLRAHVSGWKFGDVDYGKEPNPVDGLALALGITSPLPGCDTESASADEPAGGSTKVSKVEDGEPGEKKKMTHKEKVDSIIAAVETLKMKEYVERVGATQATLEVVEHMDRMGTRTGGAKGTMRDFLDQLVNPSPEQEQAMAEYLAHALNPSPEEQEAMAEFMDQALNPSPEMEEAMAEFMYQALHPTPEMEAAMAEYMMDAEDMFDELYGDDDL